MISEVSFARNFASLWRSIAPTMDLFVRRLNLELYDRIFPPLSSKVDSDRRALINEIAFELCVATIEVGRHARIMSQTELLNHAIERGRAHAALFDDPKSPVLDRKLSRVELQEIEVLRDRLHQMLRLDGRSTGVQPRPRFRGCGILDSCAGDLLVDRMLVEVKAGERSFRSTDIRQVLTYLALNESAHTFELDSVMVINPRTGVLAELGIDDLIDEVSGKSRDACLSEIATCVSSAGLSR